MKSQTLILIFSIVLLVASCNNDIIESKSNEQTLNFNNQSKITTTTIRGYNMRWRNTPDFATTNVENLIDSLNTHIFRYPGGTVTHKWDWRTGRLTNGGSANDITHLIGDVKTLADVTGGKVTFVLDVINGTIQDQIDMLHAANVPIEYIELGNELYAPEYANVLPTGASYADTINSWVPTLRTTFPNAKIGAVMIGRFVGQSNPRSNTWNQDVYNNITEPVDAHIYHVYISNKVNGGAGEDAVGRLSRLDRVYINDSAVETWITEYGDKGQNFNETLKLADALEAAPYNATVMLNHCIIASSGKFTKIEDTGNGIDYTFTPEGLAFLAKYGVPIAPSSVTATVVDCTSVNLTWTDNATNEDSFNIYQSINGGNFALIQTVAANTENYSVINLSGNTSYSFKINAVNTNGTSTDIISNNITTDACGISYNLTVNTTNGTVSPNNGSYLEGETVLLTATPNGGYEFSGWSGDASGTTNPLAITMNSDKVITANFTQIPTNTTTTLVASDDANVRNGSYRNTNYGHISLLQIRQTSIKSAKRYTYLKFDVSGVSNITSVKLRVYNIGANGTVNIKKVSNDNWSENTITWVGKPSIGAIVNNFQFNGTGFHETDVTNYVTAESQGDGTVSFVLKGATSNYMKISSKEGANAPVLIVESN